MSDKLWMVKTRVSRGATGPDFSSFFVVAQNSHLAWQAVENYLDENDLGFAMDREMASIDLLAESSHYPKCKSILLLVPPTE